MSTADSLRCDYCRTDIRKVVHIKCAECKDIHFCVDCFAHRVEIHTKSVNHFHTHSYKIIEYLTESIYEKTWGAHEELLLLDGLKRFGFCNFEAVAKHIDTDKTRQECERHYFDIYLNGEDAPRPTKRQKISPSESHRVPPDRSKGWQEKSEKMKVDKANKSNEIVMWNELRGGDAQSEYRELAECMVDKIHFCHRDRKEIQQAGANMLNVYNSVLDQRTILRKLVLTRALYNKKVTKLDEMRFSLARFLEQQETEEFWTIADRIETIQANLNDVRESRQMGLRTIADSSAFHRTDKPAREDELKHKRPNKYTTSSRRQRNNVARKRMDELLSAGRSKKTDYTREPGFELLSLAEKAFFYSVKPDLHVNEYFAVKYVMQKQQWQQGAVKKAFMKKTLKEGTKQKMKLADHLMKLFVEQGWIKDGDVK